MKNTAPPIRAQIITLIMKKKEIPGSRTESRLFQLLDQSPVNYKFISALSVSSFACEIKN